MYSLIQSFSLRAYLFFWAAWFVWCQTVGRWQGIDVFGFQLSGFSLPSVLIFDAVALSLFLKFVWKRKAHSVETREFKSTLFDLPIVLKSLIALLFTVVFFTVLFQVPMDWDGLDYHLPPWVEAFQNGFYGRSENPYFAARNYPKVASSFFAWWIAHFGGAFGVRGSLVMAFLHWVAAFRVTTLLLGNSKWIVLFWIALPLAMKQATTYYADLAGLSAFLCFFYFSKRREWLFAGFALALFGAMKFSNLPVAMVAWLLVHLNGFWKERSQEATHSQAGNRARGAAIGLVVFLAFALIQPLENMRSEGKPFGPLKCEILGHDFCGGTLDPKSLVVAPTLPQFGASDSYFKKIAVGFLPRKWVPNVDVDAGGFGWSFLIPLLLGVGLLLQGKKNIVPNDVRAVLVIAFLSDLVIGAHWYLRFHMIFGWVLSMTAACICIKLDELRPAFWNKTTKSILIASLCLQILWLTPQRVWFLGAQKDTAFGVTFENLKSLAAFGISKHATNPADVRTLEFFRMRERKITICGVEARPSLPLHGLKLTNTVSWFSSDSNAMMYDGKNLKPCPYIEERPQISFENTKVFF